MNAPAYVPAYPRRGERPVVTPTLQRPACLTCPERPEPGELWCRDCRANPERTRAQGEGRP